MRFQGMFLVAFTWACLLPQLGKADFPYATGGLAPDLYYFELKGKDAQDFAKLLPGSFLRRDQVETKEWIPTSRPNSFGKIICQKNAAQEHDTTTATCRVEVGYANGHLVNAGTRLLTSDPGILGYSGSSEFSDALFLLLPGPTKKLSESPLPKPERSLVTPETHGFELANSPFQVKTWQTRDRTFQITCQKGRIIGKSNIASFSEVIPTECELLRRDGIKTINQ